MMRKAHSQVSVRRGNYGTCEAAARAGQPSGGAEDTGIWKCDPPNLERGSFWS